VVCANQWSFEEFAWDWDSVLEWLGRGSVVEGPKNKRRLSVWAWSRQNAILNGQSPCRLGLAQTAGLSIFNFLFSFSCCTIFFTCISPFPLLADDALMHMGNN